MKGFIKSWNMIIMRNVRLTRHAIEITEKNCVKNLTKN